MSSLDQLIEASEEGDLARLRAALRSGCDLNGRTANHGTALCASAARGHLDAVETLLDAGADPSAIGHALKTPLTIAVERRDPDIVGMLLKRGAGATLTELNDARFALDMPTEEEKKISELLATARMRMAEATVRGGKDSELRLIRAAFNGDLAELEKAFEEESFFSQDESGVDALAYAASRGHHEAVRMILDQGMDPDREDAVNAPPLGEASKNGRTEVVRVLIEGLADVDHVFSDGYTALMYAAENGHLEVVRFLLDADADRLIGAQGKTAYTLALAKGHTAIVELLR